MAWSHDQGLGSHVGSQGHSFQACFVVKHLLGQCRESQKEKELLEKKLERTEKARAQEVHTLPYRTVP